MITQKSWDEFQACGMLWWINRILHTFGWAVVIQVSEKEGMPTTAFPARVKYRGFSSHDEEGGFLRVTEYLRENAPELIKEVISCEEDPPSSFTADGDKDLSDADKVKTLRSVLESIYFLTITPDSVLMGKINAYAKEKLEQTEEGKKKDEKSNI